MTKTKTIPKKWKKIPLVQLSIEDRILARQNNIILTSQYPYPPFKEDYVFEHDLKNLK